MARFQKGNPGKPKGAIRKETKTLKDFLVYIAENGKERMWQEMQSLKGEKFIHAYLTMLEYVQPKLTRTELTGKDGKDITVVVEQGMTPDDLKKLKRD